jgi:chemotaxis protein CheD
VPHDFYKDGTCGPLPRYYDARFQAMAVKVLPGQYYVTAREDEMLVTVLGSCVTACVRDPVACVGGMNHFMLPESVSGRWGEEEAALRYGNHAMAQLVAEVLWNEGRLDRLEVKLFGGANVTPGTRLGDHNVAYALRFLEEAGIRVRARHVGGVLPRAIKYFPASGKVLMRLIAEPPGKEGADPLEDTAMLPPRERAWAR